MQEWSVVHEIRVHGVGGPQEERLLGVRSPDDLSVTSLGEGTRLVRRRAIADGVEGYSWGGLTSSSRKAATWIVYLPFTLINGAGWAAPRGRAGRFHSLLTYALAFTATASYVLWTGYILIDLVAWQWRRRLLQAAVVVDHPWLSGAVEYAMPVVCGAVFVLLVVLLFALMIRRSPTGAIEDDAGAWQKGETFAPRFYQHRKSERLLWAAHLVIAAAAALAILGVAVARHGPGPETLLLGQLVVGVGLAQGGIVLLMWLTAFIMRTRPYGAAIATLGAVTANAAFAGVALLAIRFLGGFPTDGTRTVQGGPELGLTSTFLWSLAGGVVVAALALVHLYTKPLDTTDLAPPVDPDINRPIHGLTESALGGVRRARRIARLAHSAVVPVCLFTFAFVIGGIIYLVICGVTTTSPFNENRMFDAGNWPQWAGGVVLAALPAVTAEAFRRAAKSEKDRQALGIAWDVMLIWPRRYHPLAVPPYAADATRELRCRITHFANRDRVLVSAHSQGSGLTFIALQTMAADPAEKPKLKRVWYLTYGSHLNGLYALLFPRYFDHSAVARLLDSVAGWRNFWRRTDPIGAPIVLASREPYVGDLVPGDDALPDKICPDPPDSRPDGWEDAAHEHAPLERDRPLWLELSGHSWYLAEPQLKRWVDEIKSASPQAAGL
jgi:hypothetical protein